MARIFLSHSSLNNGQAIALHRWLVQHVVGTRDDVFLDLDPEAGIYPGAHWMQALSDASERCKAVVCLLSEHWLASTYCHAELLTADMQGKLIVPARLEPVTTPLITSEKQLFDLFGDGPQTEVALDGDVEPVRFATDGLDRLLHGLWAAGIGAEHFEWPPPNDPRRPPYRGWEPLEEADAAVFFGRDVEILRGLEELQGMSKSVGEIVPKHSGDALPLRIPAQSVFVILGPSGAGKSSFLRAGLLPRLRRDDRHYLLLDIVRPERNALTGDRGLAQAIHAMRTSARAARMLWRQHAHAVQSAGTSTERSTLRACLRA